MTSPDVTNLRSGTFLIAVNISPDNDHTGTTFATTAPQGPPPVLPCELGQNARC
jgi:hypothetical protein